MSPEPSTLKSSVCKLNESVKNERNCILNSANEETLNKTITIASRSGEEQQTDRETAVNNNLTIDSDTPNLLIKPLSVSVAVSREKRNIPSPSALLQLQDTFADPQSPSSSSTTSQSTSANDATFEPTIEMMVNDFDDEQTLNEEEALAAQESQDPDEEINTLKQESEIPLEELIAKYRSYPPSTQPRFTETPCRKKSKKSSGSLSHKKKHKIKQKHEINSTPKVKEKLDELSDSREMIVDENLGDGTENGRDEKYAIADDEKIVDYDDEVVSNTLSPPPLHTPFQSTNDDLKESDKNAMENGTGNGEILKVRRSHLLDLYPEGTFHNVVVVNNAVAGNGKDILEKLYGVEDDDEDEEVEEEEDEEYKKKVMIGTSYQATIPVGLSQYGDILPYENEDKLIWEPSQVSEREVEEYLIKIRDIKSNQQGEEEDVNVEFNEESQSKENGRGGENNGENMENNSLIANGDKTNVENAAAIDMDSQAVVKDNEQALHLLVQCGYDFKEALRRKRLNALPLNDCMSLWSEEECQKFEEGIQKYGKDFLKIRQNQVRTRTMRELVQFYYLWKKSERRDHNFANADTVDHMDIYLNEDNEYGSNPTSVPTPVGSPVGTTTPTGGTSTRRNSNASQKNISIMTTNSSSGTINSSKPSVVGSTLEKNCSTTSAQLQHKRRSTYGNTHTTTSEYNSELPAAILTSSSK